MKKFIISIIVPLIVALLASMYIGSVGSERTTIPIDDSNEGELTSGSEDIPEDAYIANIHGKVTYTVEIRIRSNVPLPLCNTKTPTGHIEHFEGISVAGKPVHGRGRCISKDTMEVTLHSADNDVAKESYEYVFARTQMRNP